MTWKHVCLKVVPVLQKYVNVTLNYCLDWLMLKVKKAEVPIIKHHAKSSTIPDLGISSRRVVSFTPMSVWPWGNIPRYPLNRRLSGTQSRSGRCALEKNIFTLREIECGPSNQQPVATDRAIISPSTDVLNISVLEWLPRNIMPSATVWEPLP
jgi:hypothetical protein